MRMLTNTLSLTYHCCAIKQITYWLVPKVLAIGVSSRRMDAHFFGRNARKIHLISYNFMAKHAFWTASFQCLGKSLLVPLLSEL